MRALIIALFLAACSASSPPPPDIDPPQAPACSFIQDVLDEVKQAGLKAFELGNADKEKMVAAYNRTKPGDLKSSDVTMLLLVKEGARSVFVLIVDSEGCVQEAMQMTRETLKEILTKGTET